MSWVGPRRRRVVVALVAALLLHGAALWWLYGLAQADALPELALKTEGPPITVVLQPPPPSVPVLAPARPPTPPPGDPEPPRERPAPLVPREHTAARGGAAPPSAGTAPPATSEASAGAPVPGGAPAPDGAPPPDAAPPEPPLTDFPRHAWGAPPTADDAPARPQLLAPGDDRATPKVPRRTSRRSLLTRVMGNGTGSALGEATERQLLADLKAGATDDATRAKNNVDGWGRHDGQPDDALTPGRKLVRSDRGGFVWVDEETGERRPEAPQPKTTGWARGAGGGVTFEDAKRPRPPQIERDDLVAIEDGGYAYTPSGWSARIFPDGTVKFDDDILSYSPGETAPIYEDLGIPAADLTQGTFDATDALMRMAGLDPYVSAKLCFLDDVAPIRDELRERWRQKRLEEAIVALRVRLDDLWADPTHDKASRRAAIFALYDNCNAEQAGATARELILSWVRLNLPEGTPDAYSRGELVSLNRTRTGPAPFFPFGPFEGAGDDDAGTDDG